MHPALLRFIVDRMVAQAPAPQEGGVHFMLSWSTVESLGRSAATTRSVPRMPRRFFVLFLEAPFARFDSSIVNSTETRWRPWEMRFSYGSNLLTEPTASVSKTCFQPCDA